jgi:predicted TIM-barrel fold metal-dependent hydrolase
MEPMILVSCDEHTGPPLEEYKPFLEKRYHARLDEQWARSKASLEQLKRVASIRPHQYAVGDNDDALKNRGEDAVWDPKKRLKIMDAEGIVWGVAHPVANDSEKFNVPPFPNISFEDYAEGWTPYTTEEKIAGARAHNRWMQWFRDATDGRVEACAMIGPCEDIDQAVKELFWLKSNGFSIVALPPPPLTRRYDPFWAASVELGMKLVTHAGWEGKSGRPRPATLPQAQVDAAVRRGLDLAPLRALKEGKRAPKAGLFMDEAYAQFADAKREFSAPDIEVAHVTAGGTTFDLNVYARGALWQLMISGALDRFPQLNITFTEIRSDWVPATLACLDKRLANSGIPMKLKPSEYFRRNFKVAASFMRPLEVQMRHEIGLEQLIFGRDYPHPEGTWPNTYDWIRGAFKGVPEKEARAILGETAIRWWGLNRAKLARIAARIGPAPEFLIGPEVRVDARRIDYFHVISNYNRPRLPVDESELNEVIDEAMACSDAPQSAGGAGMMM